MKKRIAIALLFLCLLTFFGCGQKNGFSCTTNEYGSIILDLPGEDQVYVSDDCVDHLSKIDKVLFETAMEKVLSHVDEASAGRPHLEIYIDEGYLCLYGEIIRDIDPPETDVLENGDVIASGCGVDHEHLYFRERISLEPVLPQGD